MHVFKRVMIREFNVAAIYKFKYSGHKYLSAVVSMGSHDVLKLIANASSSKKKERGVN